MKLTQVISLAPLFALVACGDCETQAIQTVEISAAEKPGASSGFMDLLSESKLVFTLPEGFEHSDAGIARGMSWEHAIVNVDADVRVNYTIRPIARMEVEYVDPHSAAPDPNFIYPMLFQAVSDAVSGGDAGPSSEFGDSARAQFNADWANATVLKVNADYSDEYSEVLLLAIHLNETADAYSIIMFNDYESAKTAIQAAMDSLKFLPQEDSSEAETEEVSST